MKIKISRYYYEDDSHAYGHCMIVLIADILISRRTGENRAGARNDEIVTIMTLLLLAALFCMPVPIPSVYETAWVLVSRRRIETIGRLLIRNH